MATLHLKGQPDGIEITEKQAKNLQSLWLNNKLPDVIRIDDLAFRKTELKFVRTEKELGGQGNSDISKEMKEYLDKRNLFLQLPLERKARQSLSVFCACFSCIGRKLTDQEEKSIKIELEEFFKDNPQRTLPDWEIIKKYLSVYSKSTFINYGEQVLTNISNSLLADKQWANR